MNIDEGKKENEKIEKKKKKEKQNRLKMGRYEFLNSRKQKVNLK